jgi:hypothetical protein
MPRAVENFGDGGVTALTRDENMIAGDYDWLELATELDRGGERIDVGKLTTLTFVAVDGDFTGPKFNGPRH